jgi:hypothetical protein
MPLENSLSFLIRVNRSVPGDMTGLIDAMCNYQNTASPRVNELYVVYKEGQHWCKKYSGKPWSSKKDETSVRWLMGEVIRELDTEEPGLGTAFASYEARTASGKAVAPVTKLGDGYSFERKTYKEDKTQMPYSGSKIAEIAEDHQVDFHKISRRQWDEMAVGQWSKKQAEVARMYFLNKIQRLRLLATCVPQAGGMSLWEDINQQTLHTKLRNAEMASLNSRQMYAMDRYGNLFVDYDDWGHGALVLNTTPPANPRAAAIADRGKSNHSSLCGGREVICAGTVFFWKGQLIHIDNSSGHYSPRPAALYSAVQILDGAGTSLDYLRVGIQKPTGGMNYYKARTFLQHGPPDWPDQNDDSNQDAVYNRMPGFQI